MSNQHVAVWIDHNEAKIFHVDAEGFNATSIRAPQHHLSRKAQEQGRHAGSKQYFDEIAAALKDATGILVVGPSSAKLDFIRHLRTHDAAIEQNIVGIETLDHPSDRQLVAYVRQAFVDNDRLRDNGKARLS